MPLLILILLSLLGEIKCTLTPKDNKIVKNDLTNAPTIDTKVRARHFPNCGVTVTSYVNVRAVNRPFRMTLPHPIDYDNSERLVVHVFGDSHSNWIAAHYMDLALGKIPNLFLDQYPTYGKLMFSVSRDGLDFLHIDKKIKERAGPEFALNPINDIIVVTYGEIDVRVQIPKRTTLIEEGKTMIKEIVQGYEKVLLANLKLLPSGMQLWVAELTPTPSYERSRVKCTQGPDADRVIYTRFMNDELRAMCSRHPEQMLFLDFFHDPHADPVHGTLIPSISDGINHVIKSSPETQQILHDLLHRRKQEQQKNESIVIPILEPQ